MSLKRKRDGDESDDGCLRLIDESISGRTMQTYGSSTKG